MKKKHYDEATNALLYLPKEKVEKYIESDEKIKPEH